MSDLIYFSGIYCLGLHAPLCPIRLHFSFHLLFAATGARNVAVAQQWERCLGKGDAPRAPQGAIASCAGNKGLKAALK